MADYRYRGRDLEGKLKIGERAADSIDALNNTLIKEGIYPIKIDLISKNKIVFAQIRKYFILKGRINNDLLVFSRQMKLLHQAGVPINDSLRQLADNARNKYFSDVLDALATQVEKGQPLSAAMSNFPDIFSSIAYSIIKIGEDSGKLSESFGYLFEYLDFDATSKRELKAVFRYPLFILSTIIFAFISLNLFVIPTFAKMYQNISVSLPWETRLLISISNFFVNYSFFLFIVLVGFSIYLYRYIKTPQGAYNYSKLLLKIPVIGSVLQRLILVRLSKLMCIILDAGLSINQGLELVKNTISNTYVSRQVAFMISEINRGISFSNSLKQSTIFTPFETQILSVGEQSGDLSPALKYISEFHTEELKYDIKKIHDLTGPVLISITAVLILIMALGIYLPVWNMINLTK